jgi:replicative DNA helicase
MARQHHSPSTEAALIAAILVDPSCLRQIESLEVEAFAVADHQAIFAAIRNLQHTGQPIDPITVASEVARCVRTGAPMGQPEETTKSIGSQREDEMVSLLGKMLCDGGSPSSVDGYVETLIRHQVTRDTVTTLGKCLARIQSDHGGVDELEGEGAVQMCRRALAEVQTRTSASSMSIGKVIEGRMREMDAIEARRALGEHVLTGVPTGIEKLDEKLGGYQFEIVTLVAGRPRMGKSSVMMTAVRAATDAGMGAHVFSLEDARSSYADRAIANVANVAVSTMRQASMQRAEYEQFMRGANDLGKRKKWRYDDRRGRTAPQIVEAWRREGEANGTKLVVVDYVQRVRPSNAREARHEQLEQTVADFADAAAADGIALLLGAQIGRGATARAGNRPTLEDIKASGALEEIAKCAVLIHRGAVYGPPTEGVDYDAKWESPMNRRPDDDEWMARLELIVAKNSNGAEGDVWATWTGHRTLAS